MKILTKKQLIDKINSYLNNGISIHGLSDWAMEIQANDYEYEIDADNEDFELMSDIIFRLIEGDVKEFEPTKRELRYFISCLEGGEKYVPSRMTKEFEKPQPL